MDMNEAEIQILASLDKAAREGLGGDRAALEESGERFWIFLEDWSEAYSSLVVKGLIRGDDEGYHLTDAGRPLAQAYNHERPDRYWYYYQNFYPDAYASAAHSQLCERVFGLDLCQEGQVDMAALRHLLELLDLNSGDHILDLGCGAGVIAKYVSDETGVKVTGLDYAASAIAEANRRTADDRARLTFVQGDMNTHDFPEGSFDALISLDTLYWVPDFAEALSGLVKFIKPGGQMGIFIAQELEDGDPLEILEADKTDFAQGLIKLGLAYEVFDYSAQNAAFWQRMWDVATELRETYEAEGNGMIVASLLMEAQDAFLPMTKAGTITRYLYHVRI